MILRPADLCDKKGKFNTYLIVHFLVKCEQLIGTRRGMGIIMTVIVSQGATKGLATFSPKR